MRKSKTTKLEKIEKHLDKAYDLLAALSESDQIALAEACNDTDWTVDAIRINTLLYSSMVLRAWTSTTRTNLKGEC